MTGHLQAFGPACYLTGHGPRATGHGRPATRDGWKVEKCVLSSLARVAPAGGLAIRVSMMGRFSSLLKGWIL